MASDNSKRQGAVSLRLPGISSLTVAGYKSISREQTIEVRPLTILAGANSSGKSSIVQPALLLKQTLESSYDPGPLLLNGPNVKFTSIDQLLSRAGKSRTVTHFTVGISMAGGPRVILRYGKQSRRGVEIQEMVSQTATEDVVLRPGMDSEEIHAALPTHERMMLDRLARRTDDRLHWRVKRNKCFLTVELKGADEPEDYVHFGTPLNGYK